MTKLRQIINKKTGKVIAYEDCPKHLQSHIDQYGYEDEPLGSVVIGEAIEVEPLFQEFVNALETAPEVKKKFLEIKKVKTFEEVWVSWLNEAMNGEQE